MTITLLQKLIAQGVYNYYSKQIEVICESEFFGTSPLTLRVRLYLYINKDLINTEEIEGSNWFELKAGIRLAVNRLKEKAYMEI